jgi:DNA-binding beta-propeller fold protein YncE
MTQTNDPPLISSLELIPDANEKADLDAPSGSGGKLVIGQAPNITITETTVVADAAERLALDVQEGDVAIQQNVSSSFIFTGGDNIAPNWQVIDFDAVGAIAGETISPANVDISGSINGADTSAAAAGEALTSDGSGSLAFASVGGIEEVATFGDLPAIDPPQLGFVTSENEYYHSKPKTGDNFDITNIQKTTTATLVNSEPNGIRWGPDGSKLFTLDKGGNRELAEYVTPVPFDVRFLSLNIESTALGSGGSPADLIFNDTGDKLIVCDQNSDELKILTLNSFDFSTLTLSNTISSFSESPNGLAFNDDGTVFYECELFDNIFQIDLSTPYDVTTGTKRNEVTFPNTDRKSGITFNPDGSKLFVSDAGVNSIFVYDLSTPFDLTTRTLSSQEPSDIDSPKCVIFDNDGKNHYLTNSDFNTNGPQIMERRNATGGWETF